LTFKKRFTLSMNVIQRQRNMSRCQWRDKDEMNGKVIKSRRAASDFAWRTALEMNVKWEATRTLSSDPPEASHRREEAKKIVSLDNKSPNYTDSAFDIINNWATPEEEKKS
jgi:hypothetical protein